MSYSEIKNLLQSGMPREVIAAGLALGIPAESIENVYFGSYADDENFAQGYADDTGAMEKELSWPYTCIDWKEAAEELMSDFIEKDGHYFNKNY